MKLKNLLSILLCVLVVLPITFAATEEEVDAGLTPEDNFYFIDQLGETLILTFTFNEQNKLNKHIEFAKERESELKKVTNENAIVKIEKNFKKNIEKAKSFARSEDESKTVEEISSKHEQVLNEVLAKVPESAKKGIENAIKQSEAEIEEKMNSKGKSSLEIELFDDEKKLVYEIPEKYEKYSTEFEDNIFRIEINRGVDDISFDYVDYYVIEDDKIYKFDKDLESFDYKIKIDGDKLDNLQEKYESGENITFDEISDIADIPLSLKAKGIYRTAKDEIISKVIIE